MCNKYTSAKANMRQAGELVCFLRVTSIGAEAVNREGIHNSSYYGYFLIMDIAHNITQLFMFSLVKKKNEKKQTKKNNLKLNHLHPKPHTAITKAGARFFWFQTTTEAPEVS